MTYSAVGSVASGWSTNYAESWADLTGWTTTNGTPEVSSGKMRPDIGSNTTATVTRALSGLDGLAVRLVLPSRASLSVGLSGTYVATLSFGGTAGLSARRVGSGAVTYGLTAAGEYVPSDIAATGPVYLIASKDRHAVSLVHGAVSVQRELATAVDVASIIASASKGSAIGAFTVEAAAGVPVSTSTTSTLDVAEAWLIHPSQPSLSTAIESPSSPHGRDINVQSSTDSERTYQARQAIYQPNGRREAVVFPLGLRSAGSWTLVLNTHTLDARNDLLTLLDDQAPVLLRSPGDANWDLPDGWYAVGDVSVSRPIDIGSEQWRQMTLPLTRVAEPPVIVAPSLTWGDLMLRGYTWGDLRGYTWLDLLMGEL